MGLFSAIGSGVGAAGKGVGSLGFGLGKSIWNSGAGGKGFLIGGAAGGIYGAVSADPRMGESRLKGALWGVGIGGVGGAIGGLAIGAGIGKAKGALAGLGPKAPSANALAKMANARAIREQMSKESITRGIMGWRKSGGGGAPIRLNREPRAFTKMRGAFGSAVRRAKNYKRQWASNHRAAKSNRIYANARKMLPKARKDFWVNRAEPYLPPEGGWPASAPAPYATQRPPIPNSALIKGMPSPSRSAMVSPTDEARWAGRRDQIIGKHAPWAAQSPGITMPPVRGMPAGSSPAALVSPADEARWASRRQQINDRYFTTPADDARWASRKAQILARQNKSSSLDNFAYGPSRSDAMDSYAAGLGEDADIVRMMLGF